MGFPKGYEATERARPVLRRRNLFFSERKAAVQFCFDRKNSASHPEVGRDVRKWAGSVGS